jgi:hypothetical protein
VYNFIEYIVSFFIFDLSQNGARRNNVFNCFPFSSDDIMPLFRYINNIKELNYNIKVINSLSSFYYIFFEKITMQFLP